MKQKPCPKVLFILKKRNIYSDVMAQQGYTTSSGLFNSANFVNTMLVEHSITSDIVEVIDANSIDKEVTKFKPTHVILEAIWCPPSKFIELERLHPNVKWIVRIHSEVPFLANEGIALDWIKQYLSYSNVFISFNSKQTNKEFKILLDSDKIVYLPNYYPVNSHNNLKAKVKTHKKSLHVGCFGAIRPMKNQLIQAIAAINFANQIGKTLYFHINGNRIEQKGDNVLKNLEHLFKYTPHKLIQHPWLSHKDFIMLVQRMDIGMQVSMSETFNIVTADLVNNEIPVVVSQEIPWVLPIFKSKTTVFDSIYNKLYIAYYSKFIGLHNLNKVGLWIYSYVAKKIWINFLMKPSF
jgi:hypothetical protein